MPASAKDTTDAPVRYFDGTPQQAASDLDSDGFGKGWGINRTWSGTNTNSTFGNGWTASQQPYLIVHSTFNTVTGLNDTPVLAAVDSGGNIRMFDVSFSSNGPFTSRFFTQDTLTYDGTGHEWTLKDSSGNVQVFGDLPRTSTGELSNQAVDGLANTGTFGKIKSFTDAGGVVTNYNYDLFGNVDTVTRADAASGVSERYSYSYLPYSNSLGGKRYTLHRRHFATSRHDQRAVG